MEIYIINRGGSVQQVHPEEGPLIGGEQAKDILRGIDFHGQCFQYDTNPVTGEVKSYEWVFFSRRRNSGKEGLGLVVRRGVDPRKTICTFLEEKTGQSELTVGVYSDLILNRKI